MRIGIIKETKTPPDSRVTLPPSICKEIISKYPNIEIVVQPSDSRCFSNQEYTDAGITLTDNLTNCDILLGVKEVKMDALIPNKTYFFFSHTIKEQPYNKTLLQTIVKQNINLVDYECLTNKNKQRVIAFGRWAGIVGAHNGILAWGNGNKQFQLKAMNQCFDFKEAKALYNTLNLQGLKVVLTGTGRVANGSAEVLNEMGIKKLTASAFLSYNGSEPVYTQLATNQIFAKGENNDFDSGFYTNPVGYHSIFLPYTQKANLFINGIYWDNKAPALFSLEDMKNPAFSITTIADITCDIAPEASVPSTIKPSTIAEPVFGFDAHQNKEVEPYKNLGIDVMSVDNLPNELPRDASMDFGNQFVEFVLPELVKQESDMLFRASITKNGNLNAPYEYLRNYISN